MIHPFEPRAIPPRAHAEYTVETDEDDIVALHASLDGPTFSGVTARGAEVTLVYATPLSKTKEAAVRKMVKDHRAKRLVP